MYAGSCGVCSGICIGYAPVSYTHLDVYKRQEIEIAALTIPKSKAKEVAELLVDNGIQAIWNFAHTDLNLPKDVIVESVHLSDSLMKLSYNVSRHREEQNK